MDAKQNYFEIDRRGWTVTATNPDGGSDAHVEFVNRLGERVVFDCAAYKVWNVAAHVDDMIDDIEALR